jgi:hypothetical protein
MTPKDLADRISSALDSAIRDGLQANGAGAASDWGDYKRRAGEIQGLEKARIIVECELKALGDDDDNDDF